MKKQIRVIVAGGRNVTDYEGVERSLNNILGDEDADIVIISGTAKGADSLGARWAKETEGVNLCEIPAQWNVYGKSAGFIRNTCMAHVASHLIAFWDGESRGTANMIKTAKDLGIPVRIISSKP